MMERKYVSREEMEEFLPGFSKERFCHIETDRNFVFCHHGKAIRLVITANKNDDDDDEEDFIVDVNFCPFCGFSHLPFMDDNMNI